MAENSTHPLQNLLPEKRNNNNSNFTFWDNFPETQKDMIAINRIILKHVNTVPGLLGDALNDTFAFPGKMLRPAFVMLFSWAAVTKYSKTLNSIVLCLLLYECAWLFFMQEQSVEKMSEIDGI